MILSKREQAWYVRAVCRSVEWRRCFAKSGDTHSWLALACLPLSWQALGYAA